MIIEFYSIKEVAQIFGVHSCTIRRALKAGYLISFRIGPGPRSPYRISKESIEKLHVDTLRELAKRYKHNDLSCDRKIKPL